jgi:hypothetical protein
MACSCSLPVIRGNSNFFPAMLISAVFDIAPHSLKTNANTMGFSRTTATAKAFGLEGFSVAPHIPTP